MWHDKYQTIVSVRFRACVTAPCSSHALSAVGSNRSQLAPPPVHRPHQGDLGSGTIEVMLFPLNVVVDIAIEIVGQEAHRHDLRDGPPRLDEQLFLQRGEEGGL